MVQYKVNLQFNENEKSINEIIANVLKSELQKKFHTTYQNRKSNHHHDFHVKEMSKDSGK